MENKFTAMDENGNIRECEELATFDLTKFNKSYIIYTDYQTDSDGAIMLYASSYKKGDENLVLEPVETDEEWEQISIAWETIKDEVVGSDEA